MDWVAELIGVMVLCCCGRWVGRRVGKGVWWWVLFAGMLGIVGMVVVGHRVAGWSVVAPFSWAVSVRGGPLLMAFCVPAMLSTLIVRLPAGRRRVVTVFMRMMVGNYAVAPVVLPWVVRGSLAGTVTRVDVHGVCLQGHSYTCGPAAAVTCLRALGVKAEEGELAVAARSAPVEGTDGPMLAAAVNGLYGRTGVRCHFGWVGSVEELRVPAVVAIVSPRIGGHYVAVLEVGKDLVVVGDPMGGRDRMTREEFAEEWTGLTHAFERDEGLCR